ncbi:MAG: T9SS type A sorting domain-containing protein [Bacteroidetes bacterium]|nr:T9SS type A sorting domain-containing protein [Fibrella sp.]
MTLHQKKGWLLACCWLLGLPALAQLSVVYPHPRMVVQRGADNTTALFIAGTIAQPVDRIEARLVPALPDFGQPTDWQTVADAPRQGVFQGLLTASGGWYRLDVRGMRQGNVVSQTSVERVGVGEVFLVAGQSNAMGVPNRGAKSASERVVSIDASNKYLSSNNVTISADQPFPVPVFSTLQATSLVFPTGETAWCWGELGDAIADRYRVPVAFFNASFPATVAENWSRTAQGQPATNIFTSVVWPNLQPYANVRNTLQYYHRQFGIRAVLWHHGESDAVPYRTPSADYERHVQTLIDQSRLDFGETIPWVVARCSITPVGPTTSTAIVSAQNRLIQTPGNNVWAGPDTDPIQVPRPADGHFQNIPNGKQGISEFAQSWSRSLTDAFYATARPSQPRQFLRTGLVPAQIPVGRDFSVPFSQIGFPQTPDVRVQLLDAAGAFVLELTGQTSPSLRVRLPDTLRTGLYQVRVVARSPVWPGVPSALFRVVDARQPLNPILAVQTERDSTVRVHWLSAQEPAGSRFVIERRMDNGLFEPVGSVMASTDGQLHHLYTFTDPQVLPGTTYRIRVEAPDGTVVLSSGTIITGVDEPTVGPVIFPNPNTGSMLSLKLPATGPWTMTIVNAMGRVVDQQTVSPTALVITIPLPPSLAAGLYLVQLRHLDQHYTRRLVMVR